MNRNILLLSLIVAASSGAHAALGGNAESLGAESKALNVSPRVTPSAKFKTYEFSEPKITIRQFAGPDGKIFAVAWRGGSHPDLAALMGEHFADFENALIEAKKHHHGHAPVEIEVNGFHLEMGGHQTAVYGRAWLVNRLPDQVNTRDLH